MHPTSLWNCLSKRAATGGLLTHGTFVMQCVRKIEFLISGDPVPVMEQVIQSPGLAQDGRRIALFHQMAFMYQALRIARHSPKRKWQQQAWQATPDGG